MALRALLIIAAEPALAASQPPYVPSLPPAAGYRVDNDVLRIWTGTPCTGVTRITLRLNSGKPDSVALVMEAAEPTDVERFTFDTPPPGFRVTKQLPAGSDWRAAETLSLNLDGGNSRWSSVVDIPDVIAGSRDQPAATYLFDSEGWFNQAQVAARNGKSFLTLCTADTD